MLQVQGRVSSSFQSQMNISRTLMLIPMSFRPLAKVILLHIILVLAMRRDEAFILPRKTLHLLLDTPLASPTMQTTMARHNFSTLHTQSHSRVRATLTALICRTAVACQPISIDSSRASPMRTITTTFLASQSPAKGRSITFGKF